MIGRRFPPPGAGPFPCEWPFLSPGVAHFPECNPDKTVIFIYKLLRSCRHTSPTDGLLPGPQPYLPFGWGPDARCWPLLLRWPLLNLGMALFVTGA
jgi:hypothetical protein